MTIMLDLSPELEAKVQRAAKSKGLPMQEMITQALEQIETAEEKPLSETLSPQEFAAALDEFVLRQRAGLPVLPESAMSRAAIYKERKRP